MALPLLAQCSPEFRVLVRCARASLNAGSEEAGRLISEPIDWRNLILLAFEHGMAATLSWQLKARDWEGTPSPVQTDLQMYLSENAQFSFRQGSELAEILGEFESERIFALLRNGALVAWLLHGNLTLWDLEDPEVLVPARQERLACSILASRGYSSVSTSESRTVSRRYPYQSGDRAVWVTIVSRLSSNGRVGGLRTSQLSRDRSPMSFGGRSILMPSPETLLFLLCMWSSETVQTQLRGICDIAALTRKHASLNWRIVMNWAANCGMKRTLRADLGAARALLRAAVPLEECDGSSVRVRKTAEAMRQSIPIDGVKRSRIIRGFLGIFVPTPVEAAHRMLALAKVGPEDRVYDLGCGDGRLVILAASFGAHGVGLDVDPERIQEAQANARDRGVTQRTTFLLEDALSADLSGATVVLLYVPFSSNLELRPKLQRELRPGARIVSRRFGMADWAPDAAETLTLANGTSEPIFLWRIRS